jgi:hypothetical protein
MLGSELLRLPNGQQQLTFNYSTTAISQRTIAPPKASHACVPQV